MKKIALILFAAFVAGLLMSSCRSSSVCAAYGETNQYQIETRY